MQSMLLSTRHCWMKLCAQFSRNGTTWFLVWPCRSRKEDEKNQSSGWDRCLPTARSLNNLAFSNSTVCTSVKNNTWSQTPKITTTSSQHSHWFCRQLTCMKRNHRISMKPNISLKNPEWASLKCIVALLNTN